jgi:hypothetical protein
MGIGIGLETSTGALCPHGFTRTDDKSFYHRVIAHVWGTADLPDHVATIARYLRVSLAPLGKTAGEEFPLEYYQNPGFGYTPGEARKRWQKEHKRNEAAWQAPQAIRACLDPVITAFEQQPSLLDDLGIEDWYFTDGFFLQDVRDVHAMALWAEQQGIPLVRFLVS